MILTEQEIRKLQTQHPTENNPMPFARAIETLIEERLKAQEPCADVCARSPAPLSIERKKDQK